MGGGTSKDDNKIQQVPIELSIQAKPKVSVLKSNKSTIKPAHKNNKQQKSASVSTTNLAMNHRITSKADRHDPSLVTEESATARRKNQSLIRIKESKKQIHQVVTNPEYRQPSQKSRQKVKDVSDIIDIESVRNRDNKDINTSSHKQYSTAVDRSSLRNKKKNDPTLNELIKLYGFT